MFDFLRGFGSNKIQQALRQGAVIIDVRTVHEYDQGRIRHSINIPIERLASSVERIKSMRKPVIFCSDHDSRGSAAVRFMKQNGLKEVYNGGSWEKLLRVINNL